MDDQLEETKRSHLATVVDRLPELELDDQQAGAEPEGPAKDKVTHRWGLLFHSPDDEDEAGREPAAPEANGKQGAAR